MYLQDHSVNFLIVKFLMK